jgi:hypothetical protein
MYSWNLLEIDIREKKKQKDRENNWRALQLQVESVSTSNDNAYNDVGIADEDQQVESIGNFYQVISFFF